MGTDKARGSRDKVTQTENARRTIVRMLHFGLTDVSAHQHRHVSVRARADRLGFGLFGGDSGRWSAPFSWPKAGSRILTHQYPKARLDDFFGKYCCKGKSLRAAPSWDRPRVGLLGISGLCADHAKSLRHRIWTCVPGTRIGLRVFRRAHRRRGGGLHRRTIRRGVSSCVRNGWEISFDRERASSAGFIPVLMLTYLGAFCYGDSR